MDKIVDDMIALGKGLSITFKNMLQKPVTKQYPEQKRQIPNRTRGRHVAPSLRRWPGAMRGMPVMPGNLSSRSNLH